MITHRIYLPNAPEDSACAWNPNSFLFIIYLEGQNESFIVMCATNTACYEFYLLCWQQWLMGCCSPWNRVCALGGGQGHRETPSLCVCLVVVVGVWGVQKPWERSGVVGVGGYMAQVTLTGGGKKRGNRMFRVGVPCPKKATMIPTRGGGGRSQLWRGPWVLSFTL